MSEILAFDSNDLLKLLTDSTPQDAVAMDEKNYEAMLQKSQANQRGGSRQPEGVEAGY